MDAMLGLAQRAVDRYLPGRRVIGCEDRGTWIQQTLLVTLDTTEKLILKLSVHPEWSEPHREALKCRLLRDHGLPAPQVLAYEREAGTLPHPFILQEHMAGKWLARLLPQCSAAERMDVFTALGAAYRRLHSIRGPRSGLFGDSLEETLYPVSPNDYMYKTEIVGGSGAKAKAEGLIPEQTYQRILRIWEENLAYLKQHQPVLIHNSAFWWTISLARAGQSWQVNRLTAISDMLWWDAAYDLALLRYPPYGQVTEDEWQAFLSSYGQPPEGKRLLLYSLLQTLQAMMGVYMEPAECKVDQPALAARLEEHLGRVKAREGEAHKGESRESLGRQSLSLDPGTRSLIKVSFHHIGEVADENLRFAVIVAKHQGQLVLVRHRLRQTWEVPGGHREPDEPIEQTAHRELQEETGAKVFALRAVCEYSVLRDGGVPSYGRLFLADVAERGQLPESEIAEIARFDKLPSNLTYPEIQPHLVQRVEQDERR